MKRHLDLLKIRIICTYVFAEKRFVDIKSFRRSVVKIKIVSYFFFARDCENIIATINFIVTKRLLRLLNCLAV